MGDLVGGGTGVMLKVGRKGGFGPLYLPSQIPHFLCEDTRLRSFSCNFHSVALAADTPPSHYLGNQFPTLDFLFLIPGVIFVFLLGP